MASQGRPTKPAGRRRLATAIALCGGLATILALLLVIDIATGGRWGIVNRLRSSSAATPAPRPTSKPTSDLVAPAGQLIKACIKQTKGQDLYSFYLRDVPTDQWGAPVSGTLSTFDEPFALWLYDADCKPYKAVTVPAKARRTFRAHVGQVWYWDAASAKQPTDDHDSGVISPSHNGTDQIFSNTGRLTYYTE